MFSQKYMQEAYDLACMAYALGEVPVGAVLIEKGHIIAKAYNQVEVLRNPLAHAEMQVIHEALQKKNTKYLNECELFVTLEPCYMCAYAISLAKLKTVYFAATQDNNEGLSGSRIYYSSKHCHKPEVIEGMMAEECSNLLKKFFSEIRTNPGV